MISPNLPQETISEEVAIAYSGLFEVLLMGTASLAGGYFYEI